MLIQRLFNSEQQILFQVQRARALNLDSESEDNVDINSSINSDIHENVTTQNTFQKRLNGFIAHTDLDKKLLLGVIKNNPRLVRVGSHLLSPMTTYSGQDSHFVLFGDSNDPARKGTADSQKGKEFFKAESLKTKTEKDYLMTLAEKPIQVELLEMNEDENTRVAAAEAQ